jgi:TfoX/Sxy family transcriptional regulator of competence genes
MASRQKTIDRLLGCLSGAGHVTAKKTFGEFCVYLDGKPVGLVCDDQFFVKPTRAGRELAPALADAPPYPNAKPHLLVPDDRWDDAAWLRELLEVTADELPAPKPKKR